MKLSRVVFSKIAIDLWQILWFIWNKLEYVWAWIRIIFYLAPLSKRFFFNCNHFYWWGKTRILREITDLSLVSSTSKTNNHNITEIELLKVVLNPNRTLWIAEEYVLTQCLIIFQYYRQVSSILSTPNTVWPRDSRKYTFNDIQG
jgi:hypothetical protein